MFSELKNVRVLFTNNSKLDKHINMSSSLYLHKVVCFYTFQKIQLSFRIFSVIRSHISIVSDIFFLNPEPTNELKTEIPPQSSFDTGPWRHFLGHFHFASFFYFLLFFFTFWKESGEKTEWLERNWKHEEGVCGK